MKFFKNKLAVTILVLSVAFLGLIIYTASKEVDGLEGSAGEALSPIQKITYNINQATKDFVDFFLNFSDVKAENQELKAENEKLKDEIAKNSDLEAENERLRALLDFEDERTNYDYVATNIIGKSSNMTNGYIIDRGLNDGIEKGMIVIASKGLVGQIAEVSSNWAIVDCIIDENIKASPNCNTYCITIIIVIICFFNFYIFIRTIPHYCRAIPFVIKFTMFNWIIYTICRPCTTNSNT